MNARLQKLATFLKEGEAAVVLSESNRLYYTDFAADSGLLWVTATSCGFMTDFRYTEAARRVITDMEVTEGKRFFSETIAVLKAQGVTRLYLEDETLTVVQRRHFLRNADGVELVCDGTLCREIGHQRRVKDAEELRRIRRAQAVTEEGFSYILSRLQVGRTEKDVALDLEMYMRRNGADRVAFDFIAASGENGALPHAVPSDRRLQTGDFLTLDFGATVDGYRSDMTRTVAIGSVSDEMKAVYDIVLAAQHACLDGLRAGLSGAEGDRLARKVIERAGYGAAFGHSTGHGVGIDIHELPRLSSGNDKCLMIGEIVTVEPGIYLEGRFGVRIEDMVCITADGCENLTSAPKDLLIL